MFSGRSIWDKMSKSGHVFHLTGSRYFGYYSELSDWDFFVEDHQNLHAELEDMGFKMMPGGYDDPVTAEVWHHPDDIHVQVVTDIEVKKTAQQIIRDNFLIHGGMSKEIQKVVWYNVIRTTMCLCDKSQRSRMEQDDKILTKIFKEDLKRIEDRRNESCK